MAVSVLASSIIYITKVKDKITELYELYAIAWTPKVCNFRLSIFDLGEGDDQKRIKIFSLY